MPKHAASRKNKVLKHAKMKDAEARAKKKHARMTASLHANTKLKHAKIKHAEARNRPKEENT
jgi:hypothetical protein